MESGELIAQRIELPEISAHEVPRESIDLVNKALQVAFPQEFGNLIPQLDGESVKVVKDKSLQDYITRVSLSEMHSLVNKWNQDMLKMAQLSPDALVSAIPTMMAMTEIPGKPIFFSESVIVGASNEPLGVPIIARFLLHEWLHRITNGQTTTVKTGDQLFESAFTTERFNIETAEDEMQKNIFSLRPKSLIEFASQHPCEVTTEGGRISLKSEDSDSKMRSICSSGYDFNEALVEWLSKSAVSALTKEVGVTYPAEDAELFSALVIDPKNTQASFRHHNYLNVVDGIMSSIGLGDKHEALMAYVSGQIPGIYVSKNPGKYLT